MTPDKDLIETARIIEDKARDTPEEGPLLFALAARLRRYARQTELNDCRSALAKSVRQVIELQNRLVRAGLPLPGTGLRTPTPPPPPAQKAQLSP